MPSSIAIPIAELARSAALHEPHPVFNDNDTSSSSESDERQERERKKKKKKSSSSESDEREKKKKKKSKKKSHRREKKKKREHGDSEEDSDDSDERRSRKKRREDTDGENRRQREDVERDRVERRRSVSERYSNREERGQDSERRREPERRKSVINELDPGHRGRARSFDQRSIFKPLFPKRSSTMNVRPRDDDGEIYGPVLPPAEADIRRNDERQPSRDRDSSLEVIFDGNRPNRPPPGRPAEERRGTKNQLPPRSDSEEEPDEKSKLSAYYKKKMSRREEEHKEEIKKMEEDMADVERTCKEKCAEKQAFCSRLWKEKYLELESDIVNKEQVKWEAKLDELKNKANGEYLAMVEEKDRWEDKANHLEWQLVEEEKKKDEIENGTITKLMANVTELEGKVAHLGQENERYRNYHAKSLRTAMEEKAVMNREKAELITENKELKQKLYGRREPTNYKPLEPERRAREPTREHPSRYPSDTIRHESRGYAYGAPEQRSKTPAPEGKRDRDYSTPSRDTRSRTPSRDDYNHKGMDHSTPNRDTMSRTPSPDVYNYEAHSPSYSPTWNQSGEAPSFSGERSDMKAVGGGGQDRESRTRTPSRDPSAHGDRDYGTTTARPPIRVGEENRNSGSTPSREPHLQGDRDYRTPGTPYRTGYGTNGVSQPAQGEYRRSDEHPPESNSAPQLKNNNNNREQPLRTSIDSQSRPVARQGHGGRHSMGYNKPVYPLARELPSAHGAGDCQQVPSDYHQSHNVSKQMTSQSRPASPHMDTLSSPHHHASSGSSDISSSARPSSPYTVTHNGQQFKYTKAPPSRRRLGTFGPYARPTPTVTAVQKDSQRLSSGGRAREDHSSHAAVSSGGPDRREVHSSDAAASSARRGLEHAPESAASAFYNISAKPRQSIRPRLKTIMSGARPPPPGQAPTAADGQHDESSQVTHAPRRPPVFVDHTAYLPPLPANQDSQGRRVGPPPRARSRSKSQPPRRAVTPGRPAHPKEKPASGLREKTPNSADPKEKRAVGTPKKNPTSEVPRDNRASPGVEKNSDSAATKKKPAATTPKKNPHVSQISTKKHTSEVPKAQHASAELEKTPNSAASKEKSALGTTKKRRRVSENPTKNPASDIPKDRRASQGMEKNPASEAPKKNPATAAETSKNASVIPSTIPTKIKKTSATSKKTSVVSDSDDEDTQENSHPIMSLSSDDSDSEYEEMVEKPVKGKTRKNPARKCTRLSL